MYTHIGGIDEKKRPEQNDKKKLTCFTIMPFGGWFDNYYNGIYKKAIVDSGLEPRRADDLYRPSTIINDIWQYTKQATVILADLTDKNPNVLYELGLAHALPKPVIMVTERLEDVPFDLKSQRIIEYDKNISNWGDELYEKIKKAISEVLKDPLKSVPTAFLSVDDSIQKPKITATEKAILDIKRDLDALKRTQNYDEEYFESIASISETDAETLLETYIERGMSDREIISRMRNKGVPTSWTLRYLRGKGG